jgi:hypothetical protein
VVSVTPRPRFTPGERTPVHIVQEAGWAPEPVWTQRLEEKSSAPVGDRTPKHRSSSPQSDTFLTEPSRLSFDPLWSKYSPQHPVPKHPQSVFFPSCEGFYCSQKMENVRYNFVHGQTYGNGERHFCVTLALSFATCFRKQVIHTWPLEMVAKVEQRSLDASRCSQHPSRPRCLRITVHFTASQIWACRLGSVARSCFINADSTFSGVKWWNKYYGVELFNKPWHTADVFISSEPIYYLVVLVVSSRWPLGFPISQYASRFCLQACHNLGLNYLYNTWSRRAP